MGHSGLPDPFLLHDRWGERKAPGWKELAKGQSPWALKFHLFINIPSRPGNSPVSYDFIIHGSGTSRSREPAEGPGLSCPVCLGVR